MQCNCDTTMDENVRDLTVNTNFLCFGGSFNPIHHGHLICARVVAETLGFSKVRLIPSAQPPHKPPSATTGQELASAADRLEMCRIVAAADGLFDVDGIELRRGGPSYTIDTVRDLKSAGVAEVHWLIGADMLRYLPHWHCPLELLAETQFHVMARPGTELDFASMPEAFRVLESRVVRAPLLEISATDIRRRVRAGQPVDYLVPPGVADYIARRGLYR